MEKRQEFPISELASMFPEMTPEELTRLTASMGEHGLLERIAVLQGEVIDGRHRLAACAEAGVEPKFEHLPDDTDPLAYILAKNEVRRHLNDSQRAIVAHKLSAWSTPGQPRKDEKNHAKLHNSFNQKEAAKLLQVSLRMVSHAARVLSKDSPASPAVRLAVEQGRVKVSDAASVINLPLEVQEHALDRVLTGASKTIVRAVKQITADLAQAQDVAVRESHRAKVIDQTTTIHPCTVSDLSQLVEAGSVDVIVSNPPHGAEFLPTFSDLAAFAAHALKPAGVMVVVGDGKRLPDVLARLTHPELHWVCEFNYQDDGSPIRLGYPQDVSLRRRPLLVYGKPGVRLKPGDDVIAVPPLDGHTRGQPTWQRNNIGMALIVERFARPGQTICDPALLDRAGTPLAARNHGCLFIGAAPDQCCIDRIWKYLAEDAPI